MKSKKKMGGQGWRIMVSISLILIWTFASSIVAQLIVGKTMLMFMGLELFLQPVTQMIYSILVYSLTLFLIIWVPSNIKTKRNNNKKEIAPIAASRKLMGLRGLPTWTDIGLAPVGFIVAAFLAAGLTSIFCLFPWFNAEEVQSLGFSVYTAGVDRMLAFISLVIITPIAEEVIFRGWLYGQLREKFSQSTSEVISVALSTFLVSLLFGIVHMRWNVGVTVFALSVVMCGLREVTGTIYAGILVHMLKNGIAFYSRFVIGMM